MGDAADGDGRAVPVVSVVICTRDRPHDILTAVRSVLAVTDPELELLVVDQSSDDATARLLAGIDDGRLRLVHSAATGLSNARNTGLSEARSDVVLMTDDDCEVDPDWPAAMHRALTRDPQPVVVFGPVRAAPCDDAAGYVPDGPIHAPRTFTRVRDYDPRSGIGASMGLRRSATLELGGFDPLLGAGAPFKSAEEVDVVLRALLRRLPVAHITDGGVVHHGFRKYSEGRGLVRGYMLGTAAAHAKLVRLGNPSVVVPFARAVWGSLVPPTVSALRRREVPRIAGRVAWLARGVWRGLRAPIDRSADVFASHTSP